MRQKPKTIGWMAGFRAGVEAGKGKRKLRGSFKTKRKPVRRKTTRRKRK